MFTEPIIFSFMIQNASTMSINHISLRISPNLTRNNFFLFLINPHIIYFILHRQSNLIQQFIIQIEFDNFFIPIHPPNVKFGSPFRIFLRKMDIGCGLTIPFSPPLLVRAPRSICQNMRNSFDLVIFHNIYLST